MPRGVPVATVGVDQAENAAVLALQILAVGSSERREALVAERQAERARRAMAAKQA
jgi:5-(carboxyamino)imidazole ribonucleotide mutase